MSITGRSMICTVAAVAAAISLVSCADEHAPERDPLSGLEVGDCIGHVALSDADGMLSIADVTTARIVTCSSHGSKLKVVSTVGKHAQCSDPTGRVPGTLLYRLEEPDTGTVYCLDARPG